ncbi:MAG: beta strand repeat-containing protein, partial [Phycisphaerae bacterium]
MIRRSQILLIGLLSIALVVSGAYAQVEWTGDSTTDETDAADAANWDPAIPTWSDAVVLPDVTNTTIDLRNTNVSSDSTVVDANYLFTNTGAETRGWGAIGTLTVSDAVTLEAHNISFWADIQLASSTSELRLDSAVVNMETAGGRGLIINDGTVTLANNSSLVVLPGNDSAGYVESAGGTISFEIVHPAEDGGTYPDLTVPVIDVPQMTLAAGTVNTISATLLDPGGEGYYTQADTSVKLDSEVVGDGDLRVADMGTFVLGTNAIINIPSDFILGDGVDLDLTEGIYDVSRTVVEGASTIYPAGRTVVRPVQLEEAALLTLPGGGGDVTVNSAVTGSGDLRVDDAGALVLGTNGSFDTTGDVILADGVDLNLGTYDYQVGRTVIEGTSTIYPADRPITSNLYIEGEARLPGVDATLDAQANGPGTLRPLDTAQFVLGGGATGSTAGTLALAAGMDLEVQGGTFDFGEVHFEDTTDLRMIESTGGSTLSGTVRFGPALELYSYNQQDLTIGTLASEASGTATVLAYADGVDTRANMPDSRDIRFNNVDLSTAGQTIEYTADGASVHATNPTDDRRAYGLDTYVGSLIGNAGGDSGDLILQGTGPGDVTKAVYNDRYFYFTDTHQDYDGTVTVRRDPTAPNALTVNAIIQAANAMGSGEFVIGNGALLTFDDEYPDAFNQDQANLVVDSGGTIRITDAAPTFASQTMLAGSNVMLESDVDWMVTGEENVLLSVMNYTSTLTIDSNDAGIGTAGRHLYGAGTITGPIAGSATQVNFRGAGPGIAINDMHIGNAGYTTPVITDIDGSTPRSVTIQRNMQFDSINTYSGGTTVYAGNRLQVNAPDAAGTGDIVLDGTSESAATLVVNASGFSLNGGTVKPGDFGVVNLQSDMAANLELSGTISVAGSREVSGSLTDAGDLTVTGDTVTLTSNLGFVGNRTWTIEEGAEAAFAGDISGNNHTLSKAGLGALAFEGEVTDLNLLIGPAPGGTVVRRGPDSVWTSGTVTIDDAEAVYSVESDHDYAEVDMANSTGVIALGAATASTIDMSAADGTLRLGARGEQTLTATPTPSSTAGYVLGGGGGTLIVDTNLSGAYDLHIGGDGAVVLAAANDLTGTVHIDGAAGVTHVDAFASASAVNVNTGGSLDLNSTGIALGDINMNGGGISNSGSVLTATQLSTLFPTGNHILGGAGSGVTQVEDGALSSGSLTKVGTNTVELLGTNAYSGGTSLDGGVLSIADSGALGSGDLEFNGGELLATASTTSSHWVKVNADGGTISVDEGDELTLTGYVDVYDGGQLTVSGGGLVETTDFILFDPDSSARVDAGTLETIWSTHVRSGSFVIGSDGTLKIHSEEDTPNVEVGDIYAGGTLDVASGTLNSTTTPGYTLLYFAGSGASVENPYNVGGAGNIKTMTGSLAGAIASSNSEGHPTAYIRKFGTGTWQQERTLEGWSGTEGRKFYWDVAEGTMGADHGYSGSTGLGATAQYRDEKYFAMKHLEGIIVRSGATLGWRGTQGFFSSDIWADAYPDEDGDGWNPGEFVLEAGSTLSSSGGLTLGFEDAEDGVFLAYPTVDNTAGRNLNLAGDINFRSGLELEDPNTPLDVTVTGNS